ncbi:MAG: hypothetical protein Q9195_001635 [Heterodermia aff. obscurata]
MEERKRPAGDDESAPPLKRQATSVNGTSKPHIDADMLYQDDLERFQKEAIWRQMQEYKRDRNTVETQLKEMTKRTTYHDDHVRLIDAWFSQIPDLQSRISQLLAAEKIHITELDKSRKENENLEERLETASLRYMLAEKKLDRVKSTTVQRLERQAISGGKSESGSGLGGAADSDESKVDTEALFEAEKGRKEAVASFEKQKEHLAALEADNEKLTAQVTTLENRITHLSDEDYSRTDLFKYLKSQHEDVITRVNDLEAKNVKLREEAEKFQAERAAYRFQMEEESQMSVAEKDSHLAQAENDLARIRTTRDELVADLAMRKAAQSQSRASFDQMKELCSAHEERIKVLESEIERRNMPPGQPNGVPSPQPSIEDASTDELHNKYSTLEKQFTMLKTELQSMEKVYQKTSAVASQKVNHLITLEEKMIRLGAEKSKADQKYFAAMKAKEAREQEVRTLRAQNSKTSEIVSQLKDADSATRNLTVNLEKQISELKSSLTTLSNKSSATQQQLNEKNILLEGLKGQAEELKKNVVAKDAATNVATSAHRKAEVETEALKVSLEETQKILETWKKKALSNQSLEAESLREVPELQQVVRN